MRPSILIVEDSEAIGRAFLDFFVADGFDVRLASDLSVAERQLEKAAVVLTDLSLGSGDNQDGFEVIRLARRLHPKAVVVLLTAHAPSDVEPLALAVGADAVLTKSMSLDSVSRIVKAMINLRQVLECEERP